MPRKTKRKKVVFFSKKRLTIGASLILAVLVFSAVAVVIYVFVLIRQLPPLEQFSTRKVSQSTKIYDRTGEVLLYEIFGEEKRTIIPFESVPNSVKWATLAAEDANFYNQPAFNLKSIIRAFLINLKEGRIAQGGSTITQQLVKNVFLTSEKTITRKIKELVLAVELESRYTKDEIFSAYLNQIPYGSNAYGVEAAAQTYFDKPANELLLAESAALASLPRAPSYYSPWGERLNELIDRKDHVLDRVHELGHITAEERDDAKGVDIKFAPPSLGTIKAPHFSLATKSYLLERYGEEMVSNGGLRVVTTLDWELQEIAEEVIAEGAKRNEELYEGKNASLVVQDPKTGQILAMVGSRDYFDEEIEGNFNVATQGLRQPGSALKPFVYLTAFEKGFPPGTVIFDVPTEFVAGDPDCPAVITPASKENEDCFNPENFDGIFRGPTPLEEGLAQSINVPSVKVLYLAGFDDVLKTLSDFGVSTLKERWRYGLSLVLGGGEVRLVELVNAYATLAEEGVHHKQIFILEAEDANGNVLERYKDKARRVFNREPVRLVNQILSDKGLRSGLFQSSLGLTVFPDREVALKTGTTDDYRDAWAIGYSPSLVVGVWAGNNDNAPMHERGSSILAAVPIWSEFLNKVFEAKDYPTEIFTRPAPRPKTNKPTLNGEAIFVPIIEGRAYPQLHSLLYWADRADPLGPVPENPAKTSQFFNWETAVAEWAKTNIPNFHEYNEPIPQNIDFDNVARSTGEIQVENTIPENGEFVKMPVLVKAVLKSVNNLKRVDLYFNRKRVHALNIFGSSYNYFYYIREPLEPQNLIEIKVTDDQGNEETASIIVYGE